MHLVDIEYFYCTDCEWKDNCENVKCDVKDMPVVDAVVVVRCKDCKYHGSICCPAVHETMGSGLVNCAVDNGYCWVGRTKEETT